MAMDARPKLLRYQTLNPGVGSGRDTNAWPYLTYITPLQRRNRFSTGDIVRKVYSQIQTLLFEILPLKGCVLHFSHHV